MEAKRPTFNKEDLGKAKALLTVFRQSNANIKYDAIPSLSGVYNFVLELELKIKNALDDLAGSDRGKIKKVKNDNS